MKRIIFFQFLLLGSISYTFSQDTVIDIHCHLYDYEKSAEYYFDTVKNLDIQLLKVGGITISKQDELKVTRSHNDKLIALSKENPKIIPICSVHPYDGDSAINELKRIKSKGVKFIKLHPLVQNFDVYDKRVIRLGQEAGKLDIILLIDNATIFTPDNKEGLLNLALECPDTKFIFAHLGAVEFRFWSILGFLNRTEMYKHNIYFDISGTVTLMEDSPVEDEFIWTMRTIGIDKILLGSDFPQWSLEETLDAFKKLDLTEEEKRLIKYKNALKLMN